MRPELPVIIGAIGLFVATVAFVLKREVTPASSPCADTFHRNPFGGVECDPRARLEVVETPIVGVLCRCERDGGAP